MREIRIGTVTPIGDDPTSWYRGIGPLSALQKNYPEAFVVFPNPINWATLKLCDMLFLQRPFNQEHVNFMMQAKELGMPVWCDFDDENLTVPRSHPLYPQYGTDQVKSAIVALIRHADAVTVPTEALREKYSIYSDKVEVIPNALDDILLPLKSMAPAKHNRLVMWRGSISHEKDFTAFSQILIDAAAEFPEAVFGFFGHDPYEITEKIKSKRVYPMLTVMEYFKAMISLKPFMTYYLLGNQTDHCRSRSHVAWLEATLAESTLLAPDVTEFKRPGIINFSSPADFADKLGLLLKGEIDTDSQVKQSWAEIKDRYLLSKVNGKRVALLNRLYPGVIK